MNVRWCVGKLLSLVVQRYLNHSWQSSSVGVVSCWRHNGTAGTTFPTISLRRWVGGRSNILCERSLRSQLHNRISSNLSGYIILELWSLKEGQLGFLENAFFQNSIVSIRSDWIELKNIYGYSISIFVLFMTEFMN